MFFLLIILLGVCALAAWWWLPKLAVERFRHEIPDAKTRADVEDNFRKTIGQLIGGAAVILAAGLAYIQTQQTLSEQHSQARDTVTSQMISKAFELLGEKEDRVKRIGGVYALEGVMNTSDQYYQTGLDLLCAFVRLSTENSTNVGPPAAEVQAALTVIKRRTKSGGQIMLAEAHIPRANLYEANLMSANMNGIILDNAVLDGANLSGGAELINAHLSQLNVRRPSELRQPARCQPARCQTV